MVILLISFLILGWFFKSCSFELYEVSFSFLYFKFSSQLISASYGPTEDER